MNPSTEETEARARIEELEARKRLWETLSIGIEALITLARDAAARAIDPNMK